MLGTLANQNILLALENISQFKNLARSISVIFNTVVFMCKVQKKPEVKQEALKYNKYNKIINI